MPRRLVSVLTVLGFTLVAPALAASLDESTGRAALVQNPDNVLAALVEVQSTCHADDSVCLDGVQVVQVLLHQGKSGAGIKAGDWFPLNIGVGGDMDLPSVGDRVLFVGPAFVEKDGTRGFTARALTVTPSQKDIDELRSVIQSIQTKPGA